MKRSLTHLPAAILLMLPWMTLAQTPIPQRPLPPPTANPAVNLSSPVPASPPGAPLSSSTPLFPKFDLDFPGGTPDLLVRMIAEATGHPLNVIIPEDLASTSIPAIKLRNVTVPQVFAALSQASRREVARINGYNPSIGGAPNPIYQIHTTSYGFFTQGDQNPDSVWYFKAERPAIIPDPVPPVRPKVCRFFQLGPYLDEYKVEDITTAVETAWAMLGKTNEDQPEMKFHKDTKLLIVVGSEGKVEMINSVLQSLTRSPVAIDPATGLPVSGGRPGKLIPPHIGQPLRQ